MVDLTPSGQGTRGRVEGLIALAAPFLDVVLAVGERISRIAEPTDHEYYPISPGPETAELPGRDAPNPAAPEAAGVEDVDDGEAEVVEASAEEIPLDPSGEGSGGAEPPPGRRA